MNYKEIDEYLKPIEGENSAGVNLYESGEIYKLQQLAKGKEETQFSEAEPPSWDEVIKLSGELLNKGKDLWAVLYLSTGILEKDPENGIYTSLQLIYEMLNNFWDNLYPEIDDEDEEPYRMRLSPLETFFSKQGVLSTTIININLTGNKSNSLILADYNNAEDKKDKKKLDEFSKIILNTDNIILENKVKDFEKYRDLVIDIKEIILDKVGQIDNIIPFDICIQQLEKLISILKNGIVSEGEAVETLELIDTQQDKEKRDCNAEINEIKNRNDVLILCEKIISWIEVHEPTNPASLFIKRAKSVFNKPFDEIIDDIAMGGREQINMIFGNIIDNKQNDEDGYAKQELNGFSTNMNHEIDN